MSAPFYQYNPYVDEAGYDAALYSAFVSAGFPSTIGFLIDTSRNGWGGVNRPTEGGVPAPQPVDRLVHAFRART